MLIHDSVQIATPFSEVREALLHDPHAFFDSNVKAGYQEGEQLLARIQPLEEHRLVGKNVCIDVGEPYDRRDGMVIPLHWWATGVPAIFPRLDADIELMPVGNSSTQITISGRYDPPLGGFGRGLDRILLHRIAEASVRTFLKQTARMLTPAVPMKSVDLGAGNPGFAQG